MIEEAETLDAAGAIDLSGVAARTPGLEAVVVFLRELDHELAHWSRSSHGPRPGRLSALARPLLRAALEAQSELSARGRVASTIVDFGEERLFVESVAGFGVAAVFTASTPLGLARLATSHLVDEVEGELTRSMPATRMQARPLPAPPAPIPAPSPSKASSRTETGDRIRALLAELEASSPDPHLVRTRIALRTGLGHEVHASADALSAEAARLVEAAARELRDEGTAQDAASRGAPA
jgi:hypothetical protein